MRGRSIFFYILREIIPTFVIGIAVFMLIMLMFQALRLTEILLVHGVSAESVGQLVIFMLISFLPAILPMSLLFSVLLGYGRLSGDSEIVAMKASGLSYRHLASPAIAFGIVVAIISAKVAFDLAPWGNRQFELMMAKIGQSKVTATIKEGVFSEGFFDLVVYANKVDSEKGLLSDVFIYDERDRKLPLTIIARQGQLIKDKVNPNNNISLQLIDGNVHRTSDGSYTKVDFGTYDINLQDPIKSAWRKKHLFSMNHEDLLQEMEKARKNREKDPRTERKLIAEYHKRWALAVGCLIFAFLGVGLGTSTNRRSGKSGGMVLSLALIVGFWALYMTGESIAKKGILHPALAIWMTDIVYFFLTIWATRRSQALA